MFTTQEVQRRYGQQAKRYDLAIKLYRLLGLHIETYRMRAIELMRLKPGQLVVELGCGTGLNFPPILERIGAAGRLIGVDLTPEMFACARERVERAGWKNVELIQADIASYDLPENTNSVLSVGAFGYVTEYDRVIRVLSQKLSPGGSLVIVDGKQPQLWPSWLFRLFAFISKPFGVTTDYFKNPCWQSIEQFFHESTFKEVYGGLLYIASGTKRDSSIVGSGGLP